MKKIVLILPNIRSAFNVGSIFRTADAAGIEKIYLCGYTPRPDKDEKKIAKTALGAENKVAWEYKKQAGRLIDDLKKQGYQIIALEKTKKSLNYLKFKPKFSAAIILGNEVKGVSAALLEKSDKTVHLPMMGEKESLNVSVACGIFAYYLKFNV
ncbi:MAG TPA: TrmH family RNA methyltransferase [Candidatus Bipolaricaulota bacterium]|nr:TrmH family RNA methyltransferase [Candidatus Bipolaricaulota bacterium]